jgi:hypothetical protein
MSQARTNARRRRQAANGFAHLAPRQRPNYKRRDLATSQRHEARLRETENRIRMGKSRK